MNDDKKDQGLDTLESEADNNAASPGGDSFSVQESETDEQEKLMRQIDVETGAPPAIRHPVHLTLVAGSNDDPPGWPDF